MIVIDKKVNDNTLIKHFVTAKERGIDVRSLKDLQEAMGEASFAKMIKGVFD